MISSNLDASALESMASRFSFAALVQLCLLWSFFFFDSLADPPEEELDDDESDELDSNNSMSDLDSKEDEDE